MRELLIFGQKHQNTLELYGAELRDDILLQYAKILFQTNLKHRMLAKLHDSSQQVSDLRRYENRWHEHGRKELQQHPRVTNFDIMTRPLKRYLPLKPGTKALLNQLTLHGDLS